MKKLVSFVLAALMLCTCLAGCNSQNSNEGAFKAATLQSVKDAGKLVIATSPDFPPFEELNADGSVTGIEIDILNLICAELGVTLEIQQMDFDSVLIGIQSAKYDCAKSGITVTAERKNNMLFTDAYYNSDLVVVVRADGDYANAQTLCRRAR